MKLLFCDNSLKEFINFRGDIVSHFNRKGYDITIVAPINISNYQPRKNIQLYDINLQRSGMNPYQDLKYLIKLIKIYKQEKPDIIFHYTIKPNIYGSIAAKVVGTPSISIITGLGYAFNHNGLKSAIARLLYKNSLKIPKKILVLNKSNLDHLVNHNIIPSSKVILLEGGEGINLHIFND